MIPTKTKWLRVSRKMRCPVCGKSDWCLIAADKTAAICPRTESPKRCGDAGYLHRLADAPRLREPRRVTILTRPPLPDVTQLASGYQQAATAERLTAFAAELGVSVTRTSLTAYAVGWAASYPAWSFPMRNPMTGSVTGIRLRRSDGGKFSVKGSKEALFLPVTAIATDELLLVLEGATDAIAAHSIGFLNAVGRPSCTGGTAHLVALVRTCKPAAVVIVRDNDEPGIRGAEVLASSLALYCRDVRVIRPPDGCKDMRDWVATGATHADVERIISTANVRRLNLTITTKGAK